MAALVNGNQQRQANQPTHLVCLDVFRRAHTHTQCLFDFWESDFPYYKNRHRINNMTSSAAQRRCVPTEETTNYTTAAFWLSPDTTHSLFFSFSSSFGWDTKPARGLSLRPGPPGRITESAYQRTRANIFSIEKKIPPLVSSFFALQFFFFSKRK